MADLGALGQQVTADLPVRAATLTAATRPPMAGLTNTVPTLKQWDPNTATWQPIPPGA